MIRPTRWLAGLILGAAVLSPAPSAHAVQPLEGYIMYGLRGSGDDLLKYDFTTKTATDLGGLYLPSGTQITGMTAMAYVPRCNQIYGFWSDPSDGLTKLIYIDPAGHNALVVGAALGTGAITAATTVRPAASTVPATGAMTPVNDAMHAKIYAVQIGLTISGTVNINPNNSDDNQFILTKPDGTQITRNDLANKKIDVDANGNLYFGQALAIRVQPKGDGNQNGVIIGGEHYWMANGNVYSISGFYSRLTARLYNDHAKNGKAMGHWYLEISGTGSIQNLGTDGSSVNSTTFSSDRFGQIITVDPATGITTQVMVSNAPYDDIAGTTDGGLLYGTWGNTLFVIDPVNKTQAPVGTLTGGAVDGHTLEFAGNTLVDYSGGNQTLYLANPATASTSAAGYNLGGGDIHGGVFLRSPDVPTAYAANSD